MKTSIQLLYLTICLLSFTSLRTDNPKDAEHPCLRKQGTTTQLIVDGKPFLMLGGELHNSSAGGFEYMRPIWKKMAEANLNAVIGTASWELCEPVEGKFDFALVDSMIIGARKEGLKLVIIWFGSWKNSASTYVPEWVKLNQKRFPLAKDESGKSLNILSTFSKEACLADAKAFGQLMRHIKAIDGSDHTVLAMQVENEMGTLRVKRDFSDEANTAFHGRVPAELLNYLEKHQPEIYPGVLEAWKSQGFKKNGSWEEVFGKGVMADEWKKLSWLTEELFMAWNYSKYVGKIAETGKAEYDIPMYVNAWLKQPGKSGYAPGNYPSGGPTPQVIDVWRAGAPSIDFIAPDIYIVDEYRYVADQYTLSGNPLFIPETTGDVSSAARAFFTFGKYNTICYSPFGIDGAGFGATVNDISEMKDTYYTLRQLILQILKYQGSENIAGLLTDARSDVDSVTIGGYQIKGSPMKRFDFAGAGIPDSQGYSTQTIKKQPAGGVLIMCTAPGEYIIAGRNMSLNFLNEDRKSPLKVSYLSIDEGKFEDGKWIGRRLNGDEFRVTFPYEKSRIFKVKLYKY